MDLGWRALESGSHPSAVDAASVGLDAWRALADLDWGVVPSPECRAPDIVRAESAVLTV